MKSHIYPKSLLKRWLLGVLEHCNEKLFINKVDIENKKFNSFSVENEVTINKFLDENDFFYLDLNTNIIEEHEKKWSDIEAKFGDLCSRIRNSAQIDHKIHKSMFDSKSNKEVILNFFTLNMLRAEIFYRPIFKIKNISDKNFKFANVNSLISNMGLKTNWNLDNLFDEVKKRYFDFNFYIKINSNLRFFCNPPLFFEPDIFFILPVLGIGYIYGIKKNYWLLINEMQYSIISDQEKKSLDSNNYTLDGCFLINKNSSLEDEWLNNFLMTSMLFFWIKNVGYKTGDIYYLRNDKIDKDSWEKDILTNLENRGLFKKRIEYLQNPDNFDNSNTIEII